MKVEPITPVCEDFDGVPDPFSKKCCPSDCGDLCGSKNCAKAPDGLSKCCYLGIPDDKICGVEGRKAPCSLGLYDEKLLLFIYLFFSIFEFTFNLTYLDKIIF